MSTRPTIVLDGTPFLFTHGGVGRVTERLVREMTRLAPPVQFQLVARSLRGVTPDTGGVPLHRFRLPRAAEPWVRRLGLIERCAPADLYHATDHAMALRDPSTAVATVHDLIFQVRPEPHLKAMHAWQRRTVPPFARRCRAIIACSEHTKRDIVEHLEVPEDRVHVVYWGVDRDMFQPPEDRGKAAGRVAERFGIRGRYLLGIGCSFGRKNTGRVLEAWRRLHGRHGEHQLVLVWTPPEEAKDYEDVLRMDNVVSTGRVTDEDLVDLYGAAEATLYPSLYEGFGLPVLESMSCGTPVITSDTSSLPEVAGDAATIVDPEDTDSLATAILSFIDHKVDRPDLVARGFAQCDRFDWGRTARQTLSVYASALGRDPNTFLPDA